MSSKLIKCCGYVRVSTEEQLKGYSLEFQAEEIRKYAEQNGFEIVDIYEERGESAKDIHRTQYQQMIKDLYNNKFEVILVWKVDRIVRNLLDLMQLIQELNNKDKRLVITSTGSDSAKEQDDLFFIFQGYFSSLERKKILERTYMGMKKRAEKGLYNGGRVYGYDNINKMLAVNKFEGQIVQEIFELRAQGKGYKYIALQLNARGIKTKQNRAFSINIVKQIVNNELYIGLIKWGEYSDWSEKRRSGKTTPLIVGGKHEAIISKEMWDKVQEVNRKYKEKKLVNRKVKGDLLLTGILRCPACGHGMVMHKSKGLYYYMCGQYHNKGITECRSNLVKKEFIEPLVENIVLQLINNDEIIREMINYQEKDSNASTELAEYQLEKVLKDIKSNEEKLEALEEEYLNNLLKSDYEKERNSRMAEKISQQLIELENNKAFLVDEINEKKSMQIDENGIREVFSDFEKVYYSADRLLKKSLLKALIKRIEVSKNRRELESIEFWFFPEYRLPLGELGRTVP
ncbi:recombinase family protein [Lysinibacillus telephonicus]|uniref:recombinase family protein n=1 Tax=Lysinibacillus telephonicus TaxID=1714840 RepID=UPI00397E5B82